MRQNNSTIIVVIVMALVSFMCLSLSVAYSYVYSSRSGANTQMITTGNLNATIDFNPVSDLTFTPLSDSDGLAQESYGTINIDKNNVYSVFYNINIGYNIDFASSDLASLVPMEYIKVALFEIVDSTLSDSPIAGPVRIADLPLFSVDKANPVNDLYSLFSGSLVSGSDSKKMALKVWLDEEIPDTYNDYTVYLGINVNQEPLMNKGMYDISGMITMDGNPVSGAEIILQNNLMKTTSDASGAYKLSSVAEGTYNLTIIYNTASYDTTITIQSSDGVSVSSTAVDSVQGGADSYIQNYAFDYYTTPYKIQKQNSLSKTSNELAGSYYTIPVSYIIKGNSVIGTSEITGINVSLSSSKITISK